MSTAYIGLSDRANRDLERGHGYAVEDILDYCRRFQNMKPYSPCGLAHLYRIVAEPLGLTIGQYHDTLRAMVREGTLRLHPYKGKACHMQGEQYWLLAGQEIKAFAEAL